MESGNSGSMSSSGEEEYDSRPQSIPNFLNTSMLFGAIADASSDQPPSFFSNNQINSSFLFGSPNSSASLLHMRPHPPHSNPATDNPFLGFDLLPPGGVGSGRSSFNLEGIPGVASSSRHSNNNVLAPGRGGSGVSSCNNPSAPAPSQRDQNTNIPVRNPKKRTRASRRAPTTVLTTDTTNFRAMVQEFTGIPAPPFSGSSYSRRLDLFGGSGSGSRSSLESLYPIRPSPQKIQPPSSSSTSSQLNSSSLPATSAQNVNVLNIPNTVLTFQSLMQSQGNMAMPPPFEGISHGGLNVSLDRLQSHNHPVATDSHISDRHNNVYDEDGSSRLSMNDKYGNSNSSQRVGNMNCKSNYLASNTSSGFHQHEKGLENVASRGEGTVDSWICPSD